MQLATKVALVTGAASGFGTRIARTFAREGAKVALLDVDADGAPGGRGLDRSGSRWRSPAT